ncbi:MAG: methylenetetrahydrofolate reductase C-terminal domain-containing protein [Deltaproteobacteria bacterium]|nr:methylenetetrahydrofolate reductase C-terminal domain-containing protein [Deltaproteobacteria bacterium]MBW2340940.1 methylenetetrahydrofolate reductase C-terminal domain-containing protein [Deltaproteobacteria bacterium]
MLRSEQKPFEEILGYLEGENMVFILGCDGCAQASQTGGLPQVLEMKGRLEREGKKITGYKVVDFLCQKALVASALRPLEDRVMESDSVLVLCCGVGIQTSAAMILKPVHPGCNTINLGGSRGEWRGSERCMECGDCLLDYTGGICPLAACSKGLRNGACGGASNGRCEVSPEKPCGWELIYARLKETGRLDMLKKFVPPKAWNKMRPTPEMLSTSVWALEQGDGSIQEGIE